MSVDNWLEQKLGLKGQTYKVNLSKKELFHEAIANDRGRVEMDGPDNQKKAFSTKLGDKGPLVFLTDPTCTCLLYTSPSPRDRTRSRMPSSA